MSEIIDVSVLEEDARPSSDSEFEDSDSPIDEAQLMDDLNEAMIFIRRGKTLLDYVSDTELCKTVTKRERASMVKLAEKMSEFIDLIEANYGTIGSTVSHDLSV